MERHFEQQLEKLKKRLIKMSSLVNEQVEETLTAFTKRDTELAKNIIENEDKVDKFDVKIEKQCLKLVVLNQPVAMDLRFVFSAITINTSLERIGDLAGNIAREIIDVEYTNDDLEIIDFDEILNISRQMLTKSIDSFIQRNADLAKEVFELEAKMNKQRDELSKKIKSLMKENKLDIDKALFFYDTVQSLERMGDLCTNIVEDVYFIIEAQNIRHKYADILFGEEDS